METEPTETGPLVALQLGVPTLPVKMKFIAPTGATAFVVPVTVAVNTTEPPRIKMLGAEVRTTLGVPAETVVVEPAATAPTEL